MTALATLSRPDRFDPSETREAPEAAFRFDAPRVQFAAKPEAASKSKPVTVLARTGDPIDHWYWGRIVHDFAGLQSKPVIALDWCHDPDDLIGKLDKQDSSSGDLVCTGSIESLQAGDSADKIVQLSDRGVPYEASIFFDPWSMVLEYLPDGLTTEVNGRTVAGPLVIAREWQLRRVAICPSGADSGTEASFSARREQAASFSLNWKGVPPMSQTPAPLAAPAVSAETQPATASPAGLAAPAAAPAADQAAQFRADLKRYTDRFGSADGLEYFTAGFSWERSLEKALEKATASKQAADGAAAATAAKLAAVNLGEQTAIASSAGTSQATGSAKTDFHACMQAARAKARSM